MRILHYHPATDPMISQHVRMLCDAMGLEAEQHAATEPDQARTLLKSGGYDVLHLHGCWRNSSRTIVRMAMRQGARLVVTPHGQLEPWVQDERRWKEKLPKLVLYQRDIIRRAYAIIIQGRMEQECMQQLGWNSRTVIVRNAVVTSSITPQQMARETFHLYHRVMDSDTLALMTDDTRRTLRLLLTAGITGDRRWLTIPTPSHLVPTSPNQSQPVPTSPNQSQPVLSQSQWRHLLLYAAQSQILDTVERGIRVLSLDAPDLDAASVPCFLPDGYAPAETITSAIGLQFASENDRLLATFRHLRSLALRRRLALSHLVELDRELRQHPCDEAALSETLQERHLLPLARRLMQLCADLTGLTEGFMPVPPLADRLTRRMRHQIDDRLTI